MKNYAAILIEDDLDKRFFLESKDGRDYKKIRDENLKAEKNIQDLLENPSIRVFFLYAMPEIEAWFIADWENTFGEEYKGILAGMNAYFSTTFRKFVQRNVVAKSFCRAGIENYGYVNGQYYKLSVQLEQALQGYSTQSLQYKSNAEYNDKINLLIKANKITYSKAIEGVNMLRRLNPEEVAEVCKLYFAGLYQDLKNF